MKRVQGHLGRRRSGAALVLALIAVTVVALMSLAVVQVSSSLTRDQALASDMKRAFYLAEAGLAESYVGLMTGKTGQVGVREDPAFYGDGLFWVDATRELDGSIRLESTGMCGRGRVELGLVVRWNEESLAALGFFTAGDLVVQPGSLVDGYDSSQGPYEDQAERADGIGLYCDEGGRIGANGDLTFLSYDSNGEPVEVVYGGDQGTTKGKDKSKKLQQIRDDREEKDRPEDRKDREYTDTLDIVERGRQRQADGFEDRGGGLARGHSKDEKDESVELGDKHVLKDGGTAVFGRITCQTDSRLEIHPGTYIEGDLATYDEPHLLPPVELPDRTLQPAVDHAGSGPLVLSGHAGAFEGLRVRNDARVILEGPASLVLGELAVEDGGELVFDTSNGPIVLYVARSLHLAADSMVTYEEPRTDRLEILVAAEEQPGDEPRVAIETADPLYGMVYAPRATVAFGEGSEMFGAVVADRLELGRQVRLHFDLRLAQSDGSESMPKLRGWEIVELGALDRGGASDPFLYLGVDRDDLRMPKDAHQDLWITLKYLTANGIEYVYEGWESTFDWLEVGEILEMKSSTGPGEPLLETLKGKSGWLERKLK